MALVCAFCLFRDGEPLFYIIQTELQNLKVGLPGLLIFSNTAHSEKFAVRQIVSMMETLNSEVKTSI